MTEEMLEGLYKYNSSDPRCMITAIRIQKKGDGYFLKLYEMGGYSQRIVTKAVFFAEYYSGIVAQE